METAITVICTMLGSAGLFTLIQFLIARHDKKHDRFKDVEARLERLEQRAIRGEKDSCRTQLLFLMSHYPTDTSEIMKIAEHYFKDLKANWYLTSLFRKYLDEHNIPHPVWFDEEA